MLAKNYFLCVFCGNFCRSSSTAPRCPLNGTSLPHSPPHPAVAPQHAQLIKKGAQVFLLPLTGRDEDALATWSGRSGCFINGTEARSGVRYVLGNGSRLAFGSDTAGDYVVNFTESSGANPLVSLLMDGLAAGASPDVRDALKKL